MTTPADAASETNLDREAKRAAEAAEAELTAYAFDELPAAERASVAQRLAADPAAAQTVAELRLIGDALRAEFGREHGPGLDPARRAALLRASVSAGAMSAAPAQAGAAAQAGANETLAKEAVSGSAHARSARRLLFPRWRSFAAGIAALAASVAVVVMLMPGRGAPAAPATVARMPAFGAQQDSATRFAAPHAATLGGTNFDRTPARDATKDLGVGRDVQSVDATTAGDDSVATRRENAVAQMRAFPALGAGGGHAVTPVAAPDDQMRAMGGNYASAGARPSAPPTPPASLQSPSSVPTALPTPATSQSPPTPPVASRSGPPSPAPARIVQTPPSAQTDGIAAAMPDQRKSGRFGGHAPDVASPVLAENPFRNVAEAPLSTFSLDVDTASYATVRALIERGQRPPPELVRIEELLNAFPYAYARPRDGRPLAVQVDQALCPWRPEHRLVRIGVKAAELDATTRPALNLVFLVDVSGSMAADNRLPLAKAGLRLLASQLQARDHVAIVTYAGSADVVLHPTSGSEQAAIAAAIDRLNAGGGTNGEGGIRRAYALAATHFDGAAANRVVLCTDGDFNIGISDPAALKTLIVQQRSSGVFLTCLGFGMGSYRDDRLQALATAGNGNHAYIDSLDEARKHLVDGLIGTMVVVAKDVKLHVEFNPAEVRGWRLIGYEKRVLAAQDFANDRKDAGEIGAGQTVTALYEVVPVTQPMPADLRYQPVPPLRYQPQPQPVAVTDDAPQVAGARAASLATTGASSDVDPAPPFDRELLFVKLRWKAPRADRSQLMRFPVLDDGRDISRADADFRFAAAVAAFGMLLRGSAHAGTATYEAAAALADSAARHDDTGARRAFAALVRQAGRVMGR